MAEKDIGSNLKVNQNDIGKSNHHSNTANCFVLFSAAPPAVHLESQSCRYDSLFFGFCCLIQIFDHVIPHVSYNLKRNPK